MFLLSLDKQELMIKSVGLGKEDIFVADSKHTNFLSWPSQVGELQVATYRAKKKKLEQSEKTCNTKKFGIIRGAGTGSRLADILINFLEIITEKENVARFAQQKALLKLEFLEDLDNDEKKHIYHSHQSLIEKVKYNGKNFKKHSREEANRLKKVAEKWYLEGVHAIFRTSINAESLYIFRQKVKAVKEFGFETPLGGKLLIIRDQAEGFYANTRYQSKDRIVSFCGQYTKEHQEKVTEYALKAANRVFSNEAYKGIAIYKFHLFGDQLEKWIKEKAKAMENVEVPGILTLQPDTGLTELTQFISGGVLRKEKTKNLLVICSNEVGDLIYETILGNVNLNSSKIELYTKNVFLAPPFEGNLLNYQTVHGSADDLAGDKEEELNPIATFRIAANIAENVLEIPDVIKRMEEAIISSKTEGLNTTSETVSFIHSCFNE